MVSYKPGDVEWLEFKEYLVDYFKKTDKNNTLFANWKPDTVGLSAKVAAEHDSLTAAIDAVRTPALKLCLALCSYRFSF